MSQALASKTQQLPKILIEVTKGPHKGLRLQLNKPTISIGRGPENDVALIEDPKISRRHIEIKNTGFEITVVNVSQKNYVYFGNEQMDFKLITAPTEVLIGDTMLLIKPEKSAQTSIQLKSVPPLVEEDFSERTSLRRNSSSQSRSSQNSSTKYLLMAIILIGAIYFVFRESDGIKPVNDRLKIRTQEDIAKELEASDLALKALKQKREQTGKDTDYYARAQENFLKGFRDYQLQQYQRAIQSFQAALALYPQHELALTYKNRSMRKLNEMVQKTMLQGRRYKEKGNIRLCISSFRSVLQLVKDPNDPIYKEAESLLKECEYILSQGLTK